MVFNKTKEVVLKQVALQNQQISQICRAGADRRFGLDGAPCGRKGYFQRRERTVFEESKLKIMHFDIF